MTNMIPKAARLYLAGGLSIIPINPRTKRPLAKLLPQKMNADGQPIFLYKNGNGLTETTEPTDIKKGTWEPYQQSPPTVEELEAWLTYGLSSIAVACGAVSGGLEIIDFDVDGYYEQWREAVGDMADILPIQQTGGGGYQVAYRCEVPEGNQKLAYHPDCEAHSGRKIAVETRGEGGYALLPPSAHPSGNTYQIVQNRFSDVPTVTMAVRNFLLHAARQLCTAPLTRQQIEREATTETRKEIKREQYSGDSPIDAYNAAHGIVDEIVRHGYTHLHGDRYSRPGEPQSGGVRVDVASNKTFNFSSNDPMDSDRDGKSQPRSPFDYKLEFEHSGDMKEAIKSVVKELGLIGGTSVAQPPMVDIEPPGWVDDGGFPHDDIAPTRRLDSPSTTVDGIIEIISNSDWDHIQDNLMVPISHLDSADMPRIKRALNGVATKTDVKEFLADCRRMAKERRDDEKSAQVIQFNTEFLSNASVDLRIITNNQDHNLVVDNALDALYTENSRNMAYPVAYVRGGLLARITRDESGVTLTQEYKEAGLSYVLAQSAKWVATGTDGDGAITERAVPPPQNVVRSVLDMPEYKGFPPLAGITNAPVFGKDGHLHDKSGYSEETKLYYANGIEIGDTEPTTANVEAALLLLQVELLGDFPFKDAASATHALALTLLPFVRPMVDGPTPLHLIDSPTPGTGKGLLIEVCSIPSTGGNMPSVQAGRDDDEWRKRITACLLTGASHISIDNISVALDSGELASALTQPIWADRVLGASKEVRIPIRTIWMANGNNVVPSEEIARRIIWVRLDANREQPWERQTFRHDNLVSWAKGHRAELVTACVTLVRAWIDSGMKVFSGKRKGSFENWAEIMGGIFESIGVEGFLENDKELFETTLNESSMLVAFTDKWAELYKDTPVKPNELFRIASHPDGATEPGELWYGLLSDMLGGGGEHSRKTKMGKLLDGNRDKVIGDLKITRGPVSRGAKTWILRPISV